MKNISVKEIVLLVFKIGRVAFNQYSFYLLFSKGREILNLSRTEQKKLE